MLLKVFWRGYYIIRSLYEIDTSNTRVAFRNHYKYVMNFLARIYSTIKSIGTFNIYLHVILDFLIRNVSKNVA